MEGISFVSINNAVLLMYNLFRSVSEYPLLDSNVAMVMEVRVLVQSIIRSFSRQLISDDCPFILLMPGARGF
jgi:hypothetical protein